jgi:molybdate transport system substrate-binding protein
VRAALRGARVATLGLLALVAPALGAAGEAATKPLRVFAAASLNEPFRALAKGWVDGPLVYNFAASSLLVVQIQEGASADVIATADAPTMQRLVGSGHVEAPLQFASNRLVIAVEPGNPKQIAGLADLARDDRIVVLAAPEVPAGRYARELLDGAGVKVAPRSLEENVKAVLTKVRLGEADAGIVYASDARTAAGGVEAIEVPESARVEVTYFIAPLRAAAEPATARAFVERVLSSDGRRVLEESGFTPP